MQEITKTTKTTEIEHRIILNEHDLMAYLGDQGITISTDMEFIIEVPAGGDRSGMELDIEDCPIIVRWHETTVERGEE